MSARSFWIRCGYAAIAMFLLSPAIGALMPKEPFHRVMTRVLQVGVVVAFLVRRWDVSAGWAGVRIARGTAPDQAPSRWKRAWRRVARVAVAAAAKLRTMGMRGPHRAHRYLWGALIALVAMAAMLALSWALDGRPMQGRPHRIPWENHVLRSLVAGFAVALFEEPLCRGFLKDVLGNVWSALVFAAVHFFRPLRGSVGAGAEYDPFLAIERFPILLESWTHPRIVLMGIVSLFLFGLALNRLRERTGSLYLGMGFHAGLVFALDFYRRWFKSDLPEADRWIYGGSRLHDGLIGTVLLGLVCLAAYKMPLPKRMLKAPGG